MEVDGSKIKADNLLNTAGNISRILKEIKIVDEQIESIESDLQFTGSTRTISDCQRDLEELADKRYPVVIHYRNWKKKANLHIITVKLFDVI
jgi:predicted transcriptional regulator